MTSRDRKYPEVTSLTGSHLKVAVENLCQILVTFELLQGCVSQYLAVT